MTKSVAAALGVLAIVFATPAGTPAATVAKLNAAENAILKSAVAQAAIAKLGMYPSIQTAAEFTKVLGDQVSLWKAAVKEAGVHLE